MLRQSGLGLGWLGATSLLTTGPSAEAAAARSSLAPRPSHFGGKAKAVIHIFANGGPSHLDTFDRKLALEEYAGREIPGALPTERRTGAALPSPLPSLATARVVWRSVSSSHRSHDMRIDSAWCGACMQTCPIMSRR